MTQDERKKLREHYNLLPNIEDDMADVLMENFEEIEEVSQKKIQKVLAELWERGYQLCPILANDE
ncbi:hypothetical protein ACWA1C_08145 [Flectobacillus roseus]